MDKVTTFDPEALAQAMWKRQVAALDTCRRWAPVIILALESEGLRQEGPAMSGEFPRVVQPPHVCDFDHRWDAERQVWLCLPNPPWFGRAYSASKHSGRKDAPDV